MTTSPTTTTTTTDQHLPQQISRAYDILDEEVTRTTAERDALRQFRARFARIDPTTPTPQSASQSQSTSSAVSTFIQSLTPDTRPSSGALKEVRDAYRETVMAVPHYDDEYDESLDENLAAEVGDDLATALASHERFPPQIKQTLDHAIQQRITVRNMLLDDLDQERAALDTAKTAITEIRDWLREQNECSLDEWSLTERYRLHERLGEYEAECDAIAAARQERVQDRRITAGAGTGVGRADSRLFNAYLYESLPVTYPVLADLATLGSVLADARQRLERTLV